jgi:hypothetical protein
MTRVINNYSLVAQSVIRFNLSEHQIEPREQQILLLSNVLPLSPTPKLEAAGFSETLITTCMIIRCRNPEDHNKAFTAVKTSSEKIPYFNIVFLIAATLNRKVSTSWMTRV